MVINRLTSENLQLRKHFVVLLVFVMLPLNEAQTGTISFENLQMLPEDISREKLIENMKRITKALGTDCRFCHRTDIRDYASDEIEAKRIARKMMQMVEGMNAKQPADTNASPVTCHSCHRGQRKPMP